MKAEMLFVPHNNHKQRHQLKSGMHTSNGAASHEHDKFTQLKCPTHTTEQEENCKTEIDHEQTTSSIKIKHVHTNH